MAKKIIGFFPTEGGDFLSTQHLTSCGTECNLERSLHPFFCSPVAGAAAVESKHPAQDRKIGRATQATGNNTVENQIQGGSAGAKYTMIVLRAPCRKRERERERENVGQKSPFLPSLPSGNEKQFHPGLGPSFVRSHRGGGGGAEGGGAAPPPRRLA